VGQQTALCRYCDAPLRVVNGGASPLALREEGLPVHARSRLKQLVRGGRREEAVELYARELKVDRLEALRVLGGVMAPLLFELMQRTPLNPAGLLLGAGVPTLLIAASAYNARDNLLLAAVFALSAASVARFFFPRLLATWVRSRGAPVRARVLHCATLQPDSGRGALLLVHVELQGARGPERAEFPLSASAEAVPRITPGAELTVRRGLGLVLPVVA
jgi:hypothetical protein